MDAQVPGGGECLGARGAALDFPCKESRSELLPLTFCPRALTKELAVRLSTVRSANCVKPAEYREQHRYNGLKSVHCIHRNELRGDLQECRRNNLSGETS